ncbi:MAG: hypothetical protein ACO21N_12200 [Candidatus Nanopelagicales bacterium]
MSDASPKSSLTPEIVSMLENNKIAYETGGHSIALFTAADLIFVSPGISLTIEPLAVARRNNIPERRTSRRRACRGGW